MERRVSKPPQFESTIPKLERMMEKISDLQKKGLLDQNTFDTALTSYLQKSGLSEEHQKCLLAYAENLKSVREPNAPEIQQQVQVTEEDVANLFADVLEGPHNRSNDQLAA